MFPVLIALLLAASLQESPRKTSAAPSPDQNQYESSPAQPPPATDNEKNRNSRGTNNEQDKQNWFYRFVDSISRNDKTAVAVSTIAVALFTSALFFATVGLWWSGKRQSANELRAYVSFQPVSVSNFVPLRAQPAFFPFASVPVMIRCIWANHGRTPAYNVRVQCQVDVLPAGLTEPPHNPTRQPAGGASIFPGASITQDFFSGRALTTDEVRDVEAGTQRIYIWGTATYRWAFRKFRSRRTRFFASAGGQQFATAMLPRHPDDRRPPPTFDWRFGEGHNHST